MAGGPGDDILAQARYHRPRSTATTKSCVRAEKEGALVEGAGGK